MEKKKWWTSSKQKSRKGVMNNRLQIDLEELAKVASFHLTLMEIADWFGCSSSALNYEPYKSVIKKAHNETKQRLKQKALQRAIEESSDKMLQFCLTNYCGWSDKTTAVMETNNESGSGFTITVIPPVQQKVEKDDND
jgi:hypothetical protein